MCHDTNLISNCLATFSGQINLESKKIRIISVISVHFRDLVLPTQHNLYNPFCTVERAAAQVIIFHLLVCFRFLFSTFFQVLLHSFSCYYWHNAWVWHFNRINCFKKYVWNWLPLSTLPSFNFGPRSTILQLEFWLKLFLESPQINIDCFMCHLRNICCQKRKPLTMNFRNNSSRTQLLLHKC